ncbi:MAG: FtsX-like permease family protein [bacterium]|nr:FtsX-like permease family protein [bacterium]
MARIQFYLLYATRNLWRERRWSIFAVFSVAMGVATVVALRSLGLSISDALTGNIRASLHGDLLIERGGTLSGGFNLGDDNTRAYFTPSEVMFVQRWANTHNAIMSAYSLNIAQITPVKTTRLGILNFISLLQVDPATYPPTNDFVAISPAGMPLHELLKNPHTIVLSESIMQTYSLAIGDEVRLSGNSDPFTVTGVVSSSAESSWRNWFQAFFGFGYISNDQPEGGLNANINRMSIAFQSPISPVLLDEYADYLDDQLETREGFVRVLDVGTVLAQNERIADIMSRFIVLMGLGAMLIGGVGIINTMMVMVRRRTEEIATLKTFGLKGRQIAMLFFTESLVLGVVGSAVGLVIGIFFSQLANQYGETFLQQRLSWAIYPEALLFGLGIGVVVTAIFGVLPILTAVKVRPATILRPNEHIIPPLGVIQSLVVLGFVIASLGLITGQILGPLPSDIRLISRFTSENPYVVGILSVAITFAILGILILLLWILVWIIGKTPAFGWMPMRLAIKNLHTRRFRTAITLLAISTGMFAISSITFYGAGVREVLQFSLNSTFNGNIIVLSPAIFVPQLAEAAQTQLNDKLATLEGIEYVTHVKNYSGLLTQIDALLLGTQGNHAIRENLLSQIQEAREDGNLALVEQLQDEYDLLGRFWVSVSVRDSTNPDFTTGRVDVGREITQADRGQSVAVIRLASRLANYNVTIGTRLSMYINNRPYTFTVVGILYADDLNLQAGLFGDVQIPPDILPTNARPDVQITAIQTKPEALQTVLAEISAMFGFFPLDVTLIDGVVSRLVDQFSAIPILVGILSLGAASVIMANTVALATLERRRQIGILKAIGLKRRKVLMVMLLENGMISLMGAVLGIGLSVLGVGAMSLFGLEDFILIPDSAQPVAVLLVVVAVLIACLATLFSARIALNERVLNVLRYE